MEQLGGTSGAIPFLSFYFNEQTMYKYILIVKDSRFTSVPLPLFLTLCYAHFSFQRKPIVNNLGFFFRVLSMQIYAYVHVHVHIHLFLINIHATPHFVNEGRQCWIWSHYCFMERACALELHRLGF